MATRYGQDFVQWTEEQAALITRQDWTAIDWENIQEEIQALGRSEQHELENRLEVLLEHLLKRCYVDSAYDNRGWELTIKEQRKQLRRLLRASPSLKAYWAEIFDEIWADALSDVQDIYPTVTLPNECPFPMTVEALLTEMFWIDLGS
jgi:hypothetical protein